METWNICSGRVASILCGLACLASAVVDPSHATGVDATLVWPEVTVGHGDQYPWTQLANGDHLTVVNDGRGPYLDIGNDADRREIGRRHGPTYHGPTYNHKVFLCRNMELSDLGNPRWTVTEFGYQNAPLEFVPPQWERPGAYCFGILAIGDRHVLLPLALQAFPGPGAVPIWGGNAWVVTEDGGKTWRFRSGGTLADKTWEGKHGVPIGETTFAHTQRSVLTTMTLAQMGPGYEWNRLFDENRSIRGYVFAYAPNGHIDDRSRPLPYQREVILARLRVGEESELDIARAFEPCNWEFYAGLDDRGNPQWSGLEDRQPLPMDVPYPTGWSKSGQSWYPSCVYLKSVDRFLLIACGFTYPDGGTSALYIHEARNPWGPWRLLYRTHEAHLQANIKDRPFSSYWIPGFCDLDAGTDAQGRLLRDCYFSLSGIGDTQKHTWNRMTMARYGINIGKVRLAFPPESKAN